MRFDSADAMEESVDECRENDSQAQDSEVYLTAAKRRAGISSWLRVKISHSGRLYVLKLIKTSNAQFSDMLDPWPKQNLD